MPRRPAESVGAIDARRYQPRGKSPLEKRRARHAGLLRGLQMPPFDCDQRGPVAGYRSNLIRRNEFIGPEMKPINKIETSGQHRCPEIAKTLMTATRPREASSTVVTISMPDRETVFWISQYIKLHEGVKQLTNDD
jgi:hypothetical protein